MNVEPILATLHTAANPPADLVTLHRDEVSAIVRNALKGRWKPRAQSYVFLGDGYYVCPPVARLEAFLADSCKRQNPYERLNDCDDFSWRLKAMSTDQAQAERAAWSFALGVIWRTSPDYVRRGHAYNWAITAARKFVLIEPQTGKWRTLGEEDRNIDLVCC